ncbi:MAG: 50S ribosomal protein L21 [Bacteroidales bacterium]|nr:50S ribosomal protein L21 [Bacteroidales bacterium]MBD5229375.1 50S ribosomal protein L21 [Bacteroidales bacterium]MBD5246639.1 50S ribosomal protein L21 [Barnesiella sp.]MBD5257767.1 50S ribosomal protein L21 [Barnesiella sp.]
MFVIVEIQGQQFKAEKDKFLYVHYLGENVKEGDKVEFDRVLLADADGDVKVGAPTVEGAKVVCEVAVPLVKGDKVIVFKKKRRKGYRVKNGHRQYFTKVVIKDVIA